MTELKRLSDALYGPDGIGATDIKIDLTGHGTVEDISRMVRLAIDDIQNGGGQPIDLSY